MAADTAILFIKPPALPGNSSLNTVQHATIEEAVSSVDSTDAFNNHVNWAVNTT
jgi:hypothetical protein